MAKKKVKKVKPKKYQVDGHSTPFALDKTNGGLMTVKEIHKTTLFSLEKIMAKNQLKEIQLYKFEKWIDIKRRLEEIRHMTEYFYALKVAEQIIEDANKFCKEKKRVLYGNIAGGDR